MNITDKESTQVVLRRHSLDLREGYDFVKSQKCGAISSFVGIIRDTDTKIAAIDTLEPINAIYYDSYEAMAEKQVLSIAKSAVKSYSPYDRDVRLYVAIRLGLVSVGEASIVICASSVRRRTSNDIVMSVLERVKRSVVIWKKIIFRDGSEEWAGPCKSEASWLRNE